MKVYETANIRNVALVGHHGAGKTMIAEAMLFATGATTRMGRIADNNTASDYHESEHSRQMSIFASVVHVEHAGNKINLLDTPGFPDFTGEVVSSMAVCDATVCVLHATDPIQVGADVAWGVAKKANSPTLFLLNQCDRAGFDFPDAVSAIQEQFGTTATVLQLPVGDGSRAVIDLLLMKQLTFPDGQGEAAVSEIPGGFKEMAAELRNMLVENVAQNDEALLESYLEEGDLTEEELAVGIRAAVRKREMFPILVSSATDNVGILRVVDLLAEVFPAPNEASLTRTTEGEEVALDPNAEPVAFVFRTMSEPHVGEYSFLKVCAGTIESGMDLDNASNGHHERIGSLYLLSGHERQSVPRLVAGDIGATVKLKHTHTNDSLHLKGHKTVVMPIQFPEPRYKAAITTTTAGEEDKLSAGLHKLVAEDPSLQIIHDTDLHQLLVAGQGEMHIEIARFRLNNRFGVGVTLSVPKVGYRETTQSSGRGHHRHKKQTGGAGQFADISLIVEPLQGDYAAPADVKVRGSHDYETEWGAKLQIIDAIVSGVIDMRRFSGAIHKGIVEAMASGPVAGYPCGDVRVIIHDGKMHSVDSNEAAFKSATRHAFQAAFESATPVLLEPICELVVWTPEDHTGDVMSDLNTRRARIQGMDADDMGQKITAHAPEAELLRYATHLRSITQGRGQHAAHFLRYEPTPRNVQEKIAEDARKAREKSAHH